MAAEDNQDHIIPGKFLKAWPWQVPRGVKETAAGERHIKALQGGLRRQHYAGNGLVDNPGRTGLARLELTDPQPLLLHTPQPPIPPRKDFDTSEAARILALRRPLFI